MSTAALFVLCCVMMAFTGISTVSAETVFSQLPPMLVNRSDIDCVEVNNVVYVLGGCIADQSVNPITGSCPAITNILESFNTLSNTWSALPPAPNNRTRYAAGAYNGIIYYVGGRDVQDNIVSAIDAFNTSSLTWITPSLPNQNGVTDRSDAAAFVLNSTMFITGGFDAYYNSLNSTITLNMNQSINNMYFVAGAVPNKAVDAGNNGAVAMNGYGYTFGGFSSTTPLAFCEPIASLERYDPRTNTWTTLSNHLYARGDAAYAVLNGALYLIGGEAKFNICINGSAESYPVSAIETYDASTDTWTNIGNMTVPRFRFSGAAIPSTDSVVTIGGQGYELGVTGSIDGDPSQWDGYYPVLNPCL